MLQQGKTCLGATTSLRPIVCSYPSDAQVSCEVMLESPSIAPLCFRRSCEVSQESCVASGERQSVLMTGR